jgi:hypothetical protein
MKNILNTKRFYQVLCSIALVLFHLTSPAQINADFSFELLCNDDVKIENKTTPLNDTIFFLWTVSKKSSNQIVYTSPEVHPVFFLHPGEYDLKLEAWDKNKNYSESAGSVDVNESPQLSIITSDLLICSNQTVSSFLASEFESSEDWSYDWVVEPNDLVASLAGSQSDELIVEWGDTEALTEVLIKLTATNIQTNCIIEKQLTTLLLPQVVPEAIKIVRKSQSSDILVCVTAENEPSGNPAYLYEWGFQPKSGGEGKSQITDLHYFNYDSVFNHKINTNDYIYYVTLMQKAFRLCGHTLYFEAGNQDQKSLFSTINPYHLNIFPNPNQGQFSIEMTVDIDGIYEISFIDSRGRLVGQTSRFYLDSGIKSVKPLSIPSQNRGTYFLKFQNTNNGIHQIEKIIIN